MSLQEFLQDMKFGLRFIPFFYASDWLMDWTGMFLMGALMIPCAIFRHTKSEDRDGK